jgi:hypothetical protein
MRTQRIALAALTLIAAIALAHAAGPGAPKTAAKPRTAVAAKATKSKPAVRKQKHKKARATVAWHAVKPSKSDGRVCVRVGASQSSYYRLAANGDLEFTVHGPTKVRLITRHLTLKGKIGKRSYTLLASRDGKSVLKRKLTAPRARATNVVCGKKERVGASRAVVLSVPAGKHVYRVRVKEKDKGVAVRVFQQARTKQGTRLPFKPDAFDQICRLSLGKGPATLHYHATAARPIRLRVTGPVELLVHTRCDLTATETEARYRVEVRREGQPAGIFPFKTRKLAQGTYKECPQIAPSEDRRLYLSVPKGTWTYELQPADANTPGFMARILIPRSAVGTSGHAAR